MQNGRPKPVHDNARGNRVGHYPVRALVPDSDVPWSVPLESYKVPAYTDERVLDKAVTPYADLEEPCSPLGERLRP